MDCDDDAFTYGATCTFTCESGFLLNGDGNFTCGGDGIWNPATLMTCTKSKQKHFYKTINTKALQSVYTNCTCVYLGLHYPGGGLTIRSSNLIAANT